MTIGKVHATKHYMRYRIRSPKRFISSSFRTQDVGRKDHSLRIAGKLKSSGKWATQAILIKKSDYRKGVRVKLGKYPKIIKVKQHYRRA